MQIDSFFFYWDSEAPLRLQIQRYLAVQSPSAARFF
jgi:hypothetical protein